MCCSDYFHNGKLCKVWHDQNGKLNLCRYQRCAGLGLWVPGNKRLILWSQKCPRAPLLIFFLHVCSFVKVCLSPYNSTITRTYSGSTYLWTFRFFSIFVFFFPIFCVIFPSFSFLIQNTCWMFLFFQWFEEKRKSPMHFNSCQICANVFLLLAGRPAHYPLRIVGVGCKKYLRIQ